MLTGAALSCYIPLMATLCFLWARITKPGLRRATLCTLLALLNISLVRCNADDEAPQLVNCTKQPLLVLVTTGMMSFASFKTAALGIGRGCLVPYLGSYWSFVVVCLLPVIPMDGRCLLPSNPAGWHLLLRKAEKREVGTMQGICSSFAAVQSLEVQITPAIRASAPRKVGDMLARLACGLLYFTLLLRYPTMPSVLATWLNLITLCMLLGMLTDCFSIVATTCLGVHLAQPFVRPYCSRRVGEFWSRRWNLTTTYLFRVMIYDPIIEGSLVPRSHQGMPPASDTQAWSGKKKSYREMQAVQSEAFDSSTAAVSDDPAAGDDRQQVRDQTALTQDGHGSHAHAETLSVQAGTQQVRRLQQQQWQQQAQQQQWQQQEQQQQWQHQQQQQQWRRQQQQQQQQQREHHDQQQEQQQQWHHHHQQQQQQEHQPEQQCAAITPSTSEHHHRPHNPYSRRLLGLQATFLFSALWHQVLFFYLTRSFPAWRWLLLFVIQGPLVAGEDAVQRLWRQKVGVAVPVAVKVVATNLLLALLADVMLLEPLGEHGVVAGMVEEALRYGGMLGVV